MAINNRTTLKQIYTIVEEYIVGNKIASPEFTPTASEFTGILDKIGRQVLIYSGSFYDALPELDGEYLPLGKTIEEVHSDLKKPIPYDAEGTNTLARRKAGYRQSYYSYAQPRLTIPNTIPFNVFEQASLDQSGFISLVQDNIKTFNDSIAMAKYGRKKKLMKLVTEEIKRVMSGTNVPTEDEVDSTEVKNGSYVKTSDGDVYAVMEDMEYLSQTVADVANGKIVKLELETKLAKPVDNATGTAFVKALKNIAEDLGFARDGQSLSGATIGADVGVTMYLKRGIASVIDVDVLAGAFHQDKVAVPITFKVVEDDCFAEGVYALLVDTRMIRLHPTYMAIRENTNGEGDFINQFSHSDYTAFYSKNTYCHIFTDVE